MLHGHTRTRTYSDASSYCNSHHTITHVLTATLMHLLIGRSQAQPLKEVTQISKEMHMVTLIHARAITVVHVHALTLTHMHTLKDLRHRHSKMWYEPAKRYT